MDAEKRVDELIVDLIGSTHGDDGDTYPIVGVVAYGEDGSQQFGRTAVLPDMPDGALEAVMTTMLWNFTKAADMSWETIAELILDIYSKAHYTFQQETADDSVAEFPQFAPVEAMTAAFEITASAFLEQLHRISPTMKPIVAAVWSEQGTGFATGAAGPGIAIEEWAALLKTLLGPTVRDGQMSVEELRAVLDEVFSAIILDSKKPRPLLS